MTSLMIALFAVNSRIVALFALVPNPIPGSFDNNDPSVDRFTTVAISVIVVTLAVLWRRSTKVRVIGLLIVAALLAVWFGISMLVVG